MNDSKLKKVREQLRVKRTPNAQQTHTERTRDPRKCAFAVRLIFVSCVLILELLENDSKIAGGLKKLNTINECRCLILGTSSTTVEKHRRIMEEKVLEKPRVADHLANERTFLAWIRTSIGIMGFGFVVVKFSLFTREISVALGAARKMPQPGYSHVIGIMLVALGGLVIVFSYFRYLSTQKQIDRGVYYHSDFFAKTTTISIFIICMVLLIYLLQTR